MVILTDGGADDDIVAASDYARSFGISILAVGIGDQINVTQLNLLGQSSSNVIIINGFSYLQQLINYISSYICLQTVTVNLG